MNMVLFGENRSSVNTYSYCLCRILQEVDNLVEHKGYDIDAYQLNVIRLVECLKDIKLKRLGDSNKDIWFNVYYSDLLVCSPLLIEDLYQLRNKFIHVGMNNEQVTLTLDFFKNNRELLLDLTGKID